MCGRYRLHSAPGVLADWSETRLVPLPNVPPRWNIAPTQQSLVIRRHPETGERHLDPLRWGLVPHWAKDTSGAARLINARSETVATTPSCRDAFRKRRCLVPADGFYEWRAVAGASRKQPYAIARPSGEPMAFAGLWEGWRDPASGEVLRTFTILTTDANRYLAPLHHRMPVILSRDAWRPWLGDDAATPEDLLALLRPSPEDALIAWPIAPRVGNVREDDAGLIERLPGVEDLPPPAP